MTDQPADLGALLHLGAVINQLRPDWDPPGIRAALETALAQHPYSHVHRIATAAADDAHARTPAVIPIRCANGWMEKPRNETPTKAPSRYAAGPFQALKCAACGYTQRDDGRCNGCGADQLHPHIIGADEQRDINARGLAKVREILAGRDLVKGIPE